MAQQLTVDEGSVQNAGVLLLGAAQKVQAALGTLETALSAAGTCWGSSDETAKQFAKQYVPGRDEVLQASRDLEKVLRQEGERAQKAIGLLAGVEYENLRDAKSTPST
ncbi:hypothetical protein EV385_5395 [Krasilnikovia cinnamomea]|uniref:Uncharacterized protein n=1 Tax=Krasilnikovia cinnamomea TaxID=349313 RepID=A0A4Q7ZQR1_9ACTN|nr:hypothetical protein [Krasilnikovia cinnamomea]RZU53468.1 hypothetical protein EV385_5395 [Krasilnikovia cinnamomea]